MKLKLFLATAFAIALMGGVVWAQTTTPAKAPETAKTPAPVKAPTPTAPEPKADPNSAKKETGSEPDKIALEKKQKEERVCKGKDETTEWVDYKEAIKKSEELDLPIIFYFSKEGCAACSQMEQDIFKNPELACYINRKFFPTSNHINAMVNPDQRLVEFLVGDYGDLTPLTVFVTQKPERKTSPIIGYADKEEMLLYLKYIGDRVYLQEPDFQKYLEKLELQKNQEAKTNNPTKANDQKSPRP